MDFSFDSIAIVPELQARAIFHSDSSQVFRDDTDISERVLDKNTSYIPWGGDDEMPYNVLKKIEDDETLSTCQLFNAEICYGAGLQYNADACPQKDESNGNFGGRLCIMRIMCFWRFNIYGPGWTTL